MHDATQHTMSIQEKLRRFSKNYVWTLSEILPEIESFIRSRNNDTRTIQVKKTNPITGAALEIDMPLDPTIDAFLQQVGMSYDSFKQISRNNDHECQEALLYVVEFCNTKILEHQAAGTITDAMAKFYLVNNSRYADVSQVIHEISTKEKPAWLKTIEATPATPALSGEAIPFTEIVPEPLPQPIPAHTAPPPPPKSDTWKPF